MASSLAWLRALEAGASFWVGVAEVSSTGSMFFTAIPTVISEATTTTAGPPMTIQTMGRRYQGGLSTGVDWLCVKGDCVMSCPKCEGISEGP